MDQAIQVLQTRIQVPPLPLKPVKRERLYQLLDRGLQENIRAVLISAPAGYGKTTLLNTWIHNRQVRSAWYSLNEGDNDPARFLTYLSGSLARALGEGPVPVPQDTSLTSSDSRMDCLIPLLNRIGMDADPLVLVFDDYYLIQNQVVHDLVAYMMENAPPRLHLFLATRADPPLPLARLRGRGQVLDLRLDELRFDYKEAGQFFAAVPGLALERDQVKALHRRTEGWISGLQMASVALQGRSDAQDFIRTFPDHKYIMEYLQEEVFRSAAPEVQQFLLDTSILDRLTGPLCDSLRDETDSAQPSGEQILHELERANYFLLPLDNQHEWYRYHRLFSDLLAASLARKDPRRIPILHRRASEWFESQGLVDDAVQHSFSCDDGGYAAAMVEKHAQDLLQRSEITTYLKWVERLPLEEVQKRPRLGTYRAWAMLLQGSPLSLVELQMEESCDSGSGRALQAFICMSKGRVRKGVEHAEKALEQLPPEEVYLRSVATICAAGGRISLGDMDEGIRMLEEAADQHQRGGSRSSALMILCETAELRVRQMRLEEAEVLYTRAVDLGTSGNGEMLPITGQAMMGLGAIALERFEPEKAEELVLQGIKLSKRWSLVSTIDGYFSLAVLYDLLGEDEKLNGVLKALDDLARRFDASDLDDDMVAMLRARISARRGDDEALGRWVKDRGLCEVPDRKPEYYYTDHIASRMYKYELATAVRWLLCRDSERTMDALQELEDISMEAERPLLVIEAKLLKMHAWLRKDQENQALACLKEAINLAGPLSAVRLFIAESPQILDLLRRGMEHWSEPEKIFAETILRIHDTYFHTGKILQAGDGLIESLSARELEVLKLLPSSYTAEQLADHLVISINTLRSHMKSIYSKLDVHSRHEAVVRASELGLL